MNFKAKFKTKLLVGMVAIMVMAGFVFTREQAERGRIIKLAQTEAGRGNYFAWKLISRWKHEGLLTDSEKKNLQETCRAYARQKDFVMAESPGWEPLTRSRWAVATDGMYDAFGQKTVSSELLSSACWPAFRKFPVEFFPDLLTQNQR